MINQIIAYLLDKVIGKYVDNFTTLNVKTGIFKGWLFIGRLSIDYIRWFDRGYPVGQFAIEAEHAAGLVRMADRREIWLVDIWFTGLYGGRSGSDRVGDGIVVLGYLIIVIWPFRED